MKKKLEKFLILVAVMFLVASCNGIGSNLEPLPGYEYEAVSNEEIAKALIYLHPDKEICNEVYAAVSEAVSYGLDESYYFAEVFGTEDKIVKSSKVKRSLQAKLNTLSDDNSIKELFMAALSDENYVNHYQIYWPYSANWDGKEQPTITFQETPNTPQDENVGYRIEDDKIVEVTVNEEYSRKHPVWIINYNPIPYDEYPDFAVRNWTETEKYDYVHADGVYKVSDHVTYYCKSYHETEVRANQRPTYSENSLFVDLKKDVVSLYLRDVIYNGNNDENNSFFSGGCHYAFHAPVTDDNEINPDDVDEEDRLDVFINNDIEVDMVSVRYVFLRSEMIPGTKKVIDGLLSWKWQPFENSMWLTSSQEIYNDTPAFYVGSVEYVFNPTIDYQSNNFYSGRCWGDSSDPYELIYYVRDRLTYGDPIEACNITLRLGITKGESVPPWRK